MKTGRLTLRFRWFVPAAGLIYCWLVMAIPGWGEWYARHLYPLFATPLSFLSGRITFSAGDCFIYGSILALVIYWIFALLRRRKWYAILGHTVEFLLWIYVWFYLAWGLNYFRDGFYQRSGTSYVTYSEEGFRNFLQNYTDSLNAAFLPVDSLNKQAVHESINSGYRQLAASFGMMQPADWLRPKPMLIPSLMSGTGVLGYMGPFFNEYHVNPDLLPIQYPFTTAHEMAHVLGISNEAEANLYAYLICTGSDLPEMRASGYFALLPYVMSNVYGLLGEPAYLEWRETLSPEVREAYKEKADYWQALYSPAIGELQNKAYNLFLKGNNIPSGRQNYSEVIGLILALEAADARTL